MGGWPKAAGWLSFQHLLLFRILSKHFPQPLRLELRLAVLEEQAVLLLLHVG